MTKPKQHLQIWANGAHTGSIPVESKEHARTLKKDLEAEAHPDIEYDYYHQTLEKL